MEPRLSISLLTGLNAELNAPWPFSQGVVGDMKELGILEPFKLKLQVLLSAAEAAEMILRVDDIVKCAPRRREG